MGRSSPHAVTEFANRDLEWLIHRQIYTQGIDVVQIEYTALAQYATQFRQMPAFCSSTMFTSSPSDGNCRKCAAGSKRPRQFEYLRALRYELRHSAALRSRPGVQPGQARVSTGFRPKLAGRMDDDLRAGIDTSRYDFETQRPRAIHDAVPGQLPAHAQSGSTDVVYEPRVLPQILEQCPQARLVVVGSEPPPRHTLPDLGSAIELRGFVEDVREPLGRYAVFVCPILAGSGMRVKLLEAFAAGIPVVSTQLGAEGLADEGRRDLCLLADDPAGVCATCYRLFADAHQARELAYRARDHVVATQRYGSA